MLQWYALPCSILEEIICFTLNHKLQNVKKDMTSVPPEVKTISDEFTLKCEAIRLRHCSK